MSSVTGKTVLFTGASSGIGEEAARLLATRGATLGLVARREDRLQRLCGELTAPAHGRHLAIGADLGQAGQAAEVAERAIADLGQIDVLINNAGASIQA